MTAGEDDTSKRVRYARPKRAPVKRDPFHLGGIVVLLALLVPLLLSWIVPLVVRLFGRN